MKTKCVFLLAAVAALMMISVSARSQVKVGNEKIYYLEVFEINMLTEKSVSINYGVAVPFGSAMKIGNDNNEIIKFDNALGALNYLGSYGWELVSTYTKITKGSHRSTHYLLKLDTNIHPADKFAGRIDDLLASLEAEPIQ